MVNMTKRQPGTTAVDLGKVSDTQAVNMAKASMVYLDRVGFDLPCDRKIYIDRSGSMATTTTPEAVGIIAKATAAASLVTDQNGVIELYGYDSTVFGEVEVHPSDIGRVAAMVPGLRGGTYLAPVIRHAMASVEPGGIPLIATIITDGMHFDPAEADKALIESASLPVMFVFISVHRDGDKVLKRLDDLESHMDLYDKGKDYRKDKYKGLRLLDNTAAVYCHKPLGISDEAWGEMINTGVDKWIRQGRTAGVLPTAA
jgi:hypothetical protein